MMPVDRVRGHEPVLIWCDGIIADVGRIGGGAPPGSPACSFVLVLISRVANSRSSSPVSSCGFSKLPRFLSDTAKIHGPSVSPRFPRVARATRNNSVQQSVRQYLIEGSELFAVHRYPVARSSWAASARNSWPVGRPQVSPSCESNRLKLFGSLFGSI